MSATHVPGIRSLTGKNGVNIEGMAVQDGRLFFGFRGPVAKDGAKILSVDAKALFEGGDADPKLFTVALGKGRSVRDLLAVSDGILVLAGPDDDEREREARLHRLALERPGRQGQRQAAGDARPRRRAVQSCRDCDEESSPKRSPCSTTSRASPIRPSSSPTASATAGRCVSAFRADPPALIRHAQGACLAGGKHGLESQHPS